MIKEHNLFHKIKDELSTKVKALPIGDPSLFEDAQSYYDHVGGGEGRH